MRRIKVHLEISMEAQEKYDALVQQMKSLKKSKARVGESGTLLEQLSQLRLLASKAKVSLPAPFFLYVSIWHVRTYSVCPYFAPAHMRTCLCMNPPGVIIERLTKHRPSGKSCSRAHPPVPRGGERPHCCIRLVQRDGQRPARVSACSRHSFGW